MKDDVQPHSRYNLPEFQEFDDGLRAETEVAGSVEMGIWDDAIVCEPSMAAKDCDQALVRYEVRSHRCEAMAIGARR